MIAKVLLSLAAISTPEEPAMRCAFDQAAMLALDRIAFDQDPERGWRILERRQCLAEAADLIRDWRTANAPEDGVLSWHEGQIRADLGQDDAAIRLFQAAKRPKEIDAKWGWNHYVEATIAFVRRDRAAFMKSRSALASLPRPAELSRTVGPDGKPRTVSWPMNLNVLDDLLRCWGKTYRVAYRCPRVGDIK